MEKEELLLSFMDIDTYNKSHLDKVLMYIDDKDEYIRELVAELLINFTESKEAKKALINLASDKESLVRCEAYDSLSEYVYEDIKQYLEEAIVREIDELACSYAITSWAEIVVNMCDEFRECIIFIDKIQELDIVKNSEHCMLKCSYAKYLFEVENELDIVLEFIKSDDYHIRCSAINTLYYLVDDINKKRILDILEDVLEKEKVYAVQESLKEFISEIDDDYPITGIIEDI